MTQNRKKERKETNSVFVVFADFYDVNTLWLISRTNMKLLNTDLRKYGQNQSKLGRISRS